MIPLSLGLSLWLSLSAAANPAPQVESAQRLDALVEAKLKRLELTRQMASDDATILRRLYLDLTGRIPPVRRVQEFLLDKDPDKRAKLIDDLIASEEFAEHWGRTWAEQITGKRPIKQEKYDARVLQAYLGESFSKGVPYKKVARELITGQGLSDSSGPANFLLRYEAKATDLAGAVAKQFLGASLQCAQCHDHPFAKWHQEDFWGFAAFFGRLRLLESSDENNAYITALLETKRGELMVPDPKAAPDPNGNPVKKKVAPRLPGATGPVTSEQRRTVLADWITGDDNPAFARNFVNRVWGLVWGAPLVGSLEREIKEGDGQHVELLQFLTEDFKRGGQDIRKLLRTIANSRTYQQSARSAATTNGDEDRRLKESRNLARFPTRPLTVDQLYTSIAQVTGHLGADGVSGLAGMAGAEPAEDDLPDIEQDLAVEQLGERALTVQRSLALLHSEFLERASHAGARTALGINGSRIDAKQVEWLFHALLSRSPTPEEAEYFLKFLKEGKPQKGLQDAFWALLNSVEFVTNH